MIHYNTYYGSVLNDEITSAWQNCLAAAQRYGSYVAAMGQIDADIEASSSSGSNLAVGATSDYSADMTAATKASAVKSKISEMQANSAQWTKGGANNGALEARNSQLASEIEDILGVKLRRGDDGVWYIGDSKEKLYDNWQKYIYLFKQNFVLVLLADPVLEPALVPCRECHKRRTESSQTSLLDRLRRVPKENSPQSTGAQCDTRLLLSAFLPFFPLEMSFVIC